MSEAEVKSRAMSELGYKVTATQLELAAAEAELLDDDELEQVAGGKHVSYPKVKCGTAYSRGEVPHCWDTNNGCKLVYHY